METTNKMIVPKRDHTYVRPVLTSFIRKEKGKEPVQLLGWKKKFLMLRIKLHVLYLAFSNYYSLRHIIKVVKELLILRNKVYGSSDRKIFKFGNKYYYDYFTPAFPSKAYDDYIEKKFSQIIPLRKKINALTFIILAITTKCPLRCEHCFEWENLNKKETFSREELSEIMHKYKEEGICQFHLSGGEPMVRIKDLVYLLEKADKSSEYWIYTSGFNFTRENARVLANAGATGIVVSLDHYDADMHNDFRKFPDAFEWAIQAIYNAKQAGLLVAVSLCVTRAFSTWAQLLHYVEFVKSLGVPFIQLLEPKSVGNYKGKSVLLNTEQQQLLEKFYLTINNHPKYKEYPAIIYHGYHQRPLGCFSGGYDNLYIDSAGNVDACPFCQSKAFNIKEVLHNGESLYEHYKSLRCPEYGKMKF